MTETNIAYRTADHLRWQQLDFVVGIEIRLSGNHTSLGGDGRPHTLHDMCDDLAGRYPKDFKFTGWHPQCRCQAVPILKNEEEMAKDAKRILAGEQPEKGSENAVTETPDSFGKWVEANSDRIAKAEKRGTLPYFIRDNRKVVKDIMEKKAAKEKEQARIEANRRESERLNADPNYTDVEFNPKNGGLKATHVEHEKHTDVDKKRLAFGTMTPWDLEQECQDILFQNGYSCIFNSEHVFDPVTKKQLKVLDTTTNGMPMDIASITQNGKNTIRSAISKKRQQIKEINSRTGNNYNTLILHFHDPSYFDEEKVRKQLGETFKRIIVALKTSTMSVIVIE